MWDLLLDLAAFVRHRKKYWLFPLLVVLMLVGALVVTVPGSPLGAFVYALF
jgi:hypothetical protein